MDKVRIYARRGTRPRLLGVKAAVDGKLSLAYVKGGKLEAYITYEDLCEELTSGETLLQFNTKSADNLPVNVPSSTSV
jgi:hypothetical protein